MFNIEQFRYHLNKVLPMVYDDSLSYYEFLGKVLVKLNEVIQNSNEQNQAITTLLNDVEEFEQETDNKYRIFTENIEAEFDEFSAGVTSNFNTYVDEINGEISSFEDATNAKMNLFESYFVSDYSDLTFPIATGTYCTYNYKFYTANQNISTQESFTPSHWTEVVLTEDIQAKRVAFETYMAQQYADFLANYLQTLGVVQTTGSSTTDVMSQKATTDKFNSQFDDIESYLDLAEVAYSKYNLARNISPTADTMIRWDTGRTHSSANIAYQNVDVSNISRLVYMKMMSTTTDVPLGGLAFYDENDTYISGLPYGNNAEEFYTKAEAIDVPSNAVKASFTYLGFASYPRFFVMDEEKYLDFTNRKTDKLYSTFYSENPKDIWELGTISATTGANASVTKRLRSDFITTPSTIKITANENYSFCVYVYDENDTYLGIVKVNGLLGKSVTNILYYTKYNMINVNKNQKIRIVVKHIVEGVEQDVSLDDAKNIVFSVIKENNYDEMQKDALILKLHTIPENKGVVNFIKRARQFTDITWTPAVDLPRLMMVSVSNPDSAINPYYEGVFKSGTKYKGIPYGRCLNYKPEYGYSNTYVGFTVPFETFVTSITNPNSMLCTEYDFSLSRHESLPYACVCSVIASYALDVSFHDTAHIKDIEGLNKITTISNSTDLKILKLGDVLCEPTYHTALITDIGHKENGDVDFVEISEATVVGNPNKSIVGGQYGGVCRRFAVSADDFYWRYSTYDLLRYDNISGISYTPSQYVQIGDEPPRNEYIDYPCLPFEGENFTYKVGYIPQAKLIISTDEYAYLRVFKDGTEIENSPFTIAPNTTYVNVGFSTAGNYSAYLCNMSDSTETSKTIRCHWKVVS